MGSANAAAIIEFNDWTHPSPIDVVAKACDNIEIERKSEFRMPNGDTCWDLYERAHEAREDFIRAVWSVSLHYKPVGDFGGTESVHDAVKEEEAVCVAEQIAAMTGLPVG